MDRLQSGRRMLIYKYTFVEGRYTDASLPKIREVFQYRQSSTRVRRGGMLEPTHDARPAPALGRETGLNYVWPGRADEP